MVIGCGPILFSATTRASREFRIFATEGTVKAYMDIISMGLHKKVKIWLDIFQPLFVLQHLTCELPQVSRQQHGKWDLKLK